VVSTSVEQAHTQAAAHHTRLVFGALYSGADRILIGILIGYFFPDAGKALKPLGDAFIALKKMMIAPVIFCTVVHGISSMRDLKKVGRVGVKTLFYFEVVSTLALAIGLIVGDDCAAWQGVQYRSRQPRCECRDNLR
jgi:Na+/H+-dicarboxylate symporter